MSQYHKIIAFTAILALAGGASAQSSARKAPGRSRAIDLLAEGQTLEQQGQKEAAWQKYYESATAAPSPSAYYHLGKLARQAGQKDSARQWLNKALELNPKFELAKVELINLNSGKAANVVSTVSNEVNGTMAPGSAAALDTPMNVDALRKEVVTMQSLAPPDPKVRAEREAKAAEAVRLADSADDVNLKEGEQGESVLSPVIDPRAPEELGLPSLSETADASKSKSADGEPTADEINDAAFGPESTKEPGSKGYGQTTKVALGTFAFHREKGDDYRKASRFREAAVEYKTALKLEPNDVETRTLLAEMYGRLEKGEEAVAQFDKAKAAAPSDDRVYYKEGNAYIDQQKYDLAIGSFRKALEINPSNKLAMNNMGVAYMEKKDYSTAADKFKGVLQLDPKYDMAMLNLGIIYDEHLQDKEQALKYYDQYLATGGPRAPEVQRWADSIRAKSATTTSN